MKRPFRRLGSCILAAALGPAMIHPSVAAENEPTAAPADSAEAPGSTFFPLPFYLHSPETKSGGGVVLSYIHRDEDAPPERKPSTYTGVFLYTQRKQIAFEVSADRYWSADRFQLLGSSVFARFPDTFHGLGNETEDDVSEDFTPRTRAVSIGLRREIAPDVRVGPRVGYLYQEMAEVEEGGLLDLGTVPGSEGGTIVQVGASLTRDRRDATIYPRSGTYTELGVDASHDALGSDFDFTTWSADLRWFRSLSGSQVVAVRGLATIMSGTPPFQALAALGGDDVMRGFYGGRFRDRSRYVLQSEYRLGFWKRLGLAAFADVGDVAGDVTKFRLEEARFAGGLGLRILVSRAEEVTLRADFARGDDGVGGLYLSMLEAY